MAVIGFNVGNTLSMNDISLAVDFLSNKDAFEPDLQNIKDKITGKEKNGGLRSGKELKNATPVERGQGVPFERFRRITGYIAPDIDRWNNGKKQELKDRTLNMV